MQPVFRLLLAGLFQPVAVGLVLFLSAGTIAYWPAWLFLLSLFLFSAWLPGLYFLWRGSAALKRRMQAGPFAETRPAQRAAMLMLWPSVVLMLVICGLDHRFEWTPAPDWVCIAGSSLVATGSCVVTTVMFQNSFAATTVQVESDQRLVSTGLYKVVRHPMYMGYGITFIGVPLALGSYWGAVFLLPIFVAIGVRIHDEEQLLMSELEGYRDYMQRVPCRVIPCIVISLPGMGCRGGRDHKNATDALP